ncbi:MAG: hypothetical protein IJD39_02435 [Clostridia bacterium]|nr:hypothetical protein [Clostridia bacterium]
MFVVSLKWLPYLLVLCGIVCLFSGETDVTTSLVMTGIGGVWLGLAHSAKKA